MICALPHEVKMLVVGEEAMHMSCSNNKCDQSC